MFSYFEKGITNIIPSKTIDLPSLVKLIKNNPKEDQINFLIEAKRKKTVIDGEEYYKTLKTKLPYVTPNCTVKQRYLKNWPENFICFSQYIYFDIDLIDTNPFVAKANFLAKYREKVSMVSISASYGGLSILFKVSNKMKTEQDFINVRQKLFEKYFQDEKDIDHTVKDVGRAWFIPSDRDVYVNYDAIVEDITLDSEDNTNPNSNYGNQCRTFVESKNTLNYPYNPPQIINNNYNNKYIYEDNIISLKKLMTDYKFETNVNVKNNIVDYNPVDNYLQIKHQFVIPDGHKHNVYAGIISTFMKLNPNIEFNAVYSLIYHINNNNKQKMLLKELLRHTSYIYSDNLNNKQTKTPKKSRTKRVHYDKGVCLDINIKRKISNCINGVHRRNENNKIIKDAKQNILLNGINLTKTAVMKETGLSYKTVSKHWDSDQIDIQKYVTEINLEYTP
jgi:hypothetical protein